MNGLKRAWLHLIRKKGTSLLLFIFLLIMATLLLICLSIQSATGTANANIKKALMGYFTINAKQLDGGIDEKTREKILEIDGLSGKYKLRTYSYASYYDAAGNPLEIDTEGALEIPEGYENAGKIVANSNSKDDTYFTEAGFELIEGRGITSDDKNNVLIHENFAARNNLSIGDTIMLGDVTEKDRIIEATVTGIFTNTEEQDSLGVAPSYDLYDNITFTDLSTASYLLYGTIGKTNVEYGDFYVDDPDELDRIMKEVQEIEDVTWENCTLTRYDNDYQNAKESLAGLQNIVFIAIVAVFLLSLAVLSLFLVLRLRGRIHETGIYLAMGISKGAVLLQYLLEVVIIAIIALVLSYGVSSAIGNKIGHSLFSQVTTETYETVELNGNELEKTNEPENLGLSKVEVSVSAQDYQIVWGLMMGICIVSITLASYPVLKMKPKNILSQMS